MNVSGIYAKAGTDCCKNDLFSVSVCCLLDTKRKKMCRSGGEDTRRTPER